MNVLLVYNRNAGTREFRCKEIVALIEGAGHTVRAIRKQDSDLERHLVLPFDLVVVAGGDGTVTKVARLLIRRPRPFTVLPLGTANNLAHSIGITGPAPALIAQWPAADIASFDAIRVGFADRECVMFESVGIGLFTEAMCLALSKGSEGRKISPKKRFDRDFRLLRRMADTLPSVPCTLDIDGRKFRKNVILLEIMNARQIGSRLVLAPEATTSDGSLDLVLVSEAQRARLRRFLHRDPSADHPPHLPIRRARRIRISARTPRVHLDDGIESLGSGKSSWTLTVEVLPAALQVLIPNQGGES